MSLGPVMLDLTGTELGAEERELLRHPAVGGVILFTRNYVSPRQLASLTAAIHGVRQPSLLIGVDQEGGGSSAFVRDSRACRQRVVSGSWSSRIPRGPCWPAARWPGSWRRSCGASGLILASPPSWTWIGGRAG
mgnify:CR=1 FL=1